MRRLLLWDKTILRIQMDIYGPVRRLGIHREIYPSIVIVSSNLDLWIQRWQYVYLYLCYVYGSEAAIGNNSRSIILCELKMAYWFVCLCMRIMIGVHEGRITCFVLLILLISSSFDYYARIYKKLISILSSK